MYFHFSKHGKKKKKKNQSSAVLLKLKHKTEEMETLYPVLFETFQFNSFDRKVSPLVCSLKRSYLYFIQEF